MPGKPKNKRVPEEQVEMDTVDATPPAKGKAIYKRVLVKLSGECLCSPGGSGSDAEAFREVADEIEAVVEQKVQMAVVVGGGNFIRGRDLADDPNIQRTTADTMGMLGTVINALALRDTLAGRGIEVRVMGAVQMGPICEPFVRAKAIDHLNKGRVVLLAGGTGSPFFTTDTCASLRACEIDAEALLKATKVDGVFDSDPMVNPAAKRYAKLSYEQFIAENLGVMDLTAVSMCLESSIPIGVFSFEHPGNLSKVICGDDIGTVIQD